MNYLLRGHIKLAGNQTASIRTTIEAASKEEAKEKFKAFLLRKAEPVVELCQDQADVKLQDTLGMFKHIFG
jgi:hypothetical protein